MGHFHRVLYHARSPVCIHATVWHCIWCMWLDRKPSLCIGCCFKYVSFNNSWKQTKIYWRQLMQCLNIVNISYYVLLVMIRWNNFFGEHLTYPSLLAATPTKFTGINCNTLKFIKFHKTEFNFILCQESWRNAFHPFSTI